MCQSTRDRRAAANGNRTVCLCGRERVLYEGDGEIKMEMEMDRRGERERL